MHDASGEMRRRVRGPLPTDGGLRVGVERVGEQPAQQARLAHGRVAHENDLETRAGLRTRRQRWVQRLCSIPYCPTILYLRKALVPGACQASANPRLTPTCQRDLTRHWRRHALPVPPVTPAAQPAALGPTLTRWLSVVLRSASKSASTTLLSMGPSPPRSTWPRPGHNPATPPSPSRVEVPQHPQARPPPRDCCNSGGPCVATGCGRRCLEVVLSGSCTLDSGQRFAGEQRHSANGGGQQVATLQE